MSTAARFDQDLVPLVPGLPQTCQLTISNHSTVVESYAFLPVGELAPYLSVGPDSLSLYPGSEGAVTVTFAPPAEGGPTAGRIPFAVIVQPTELPEDRVVPEAEADLAQRTELRIDLSPRTSLGRWRAHHSLAVDNLSNHAVAVAIRGSDPDDALVVGCHPDQLLVEPGAAAFSRIRIRHRRLLWRGNPVTRQFELQVLPEAAAALSASGRVVQGAVIPRGTGKALAALAAAAIALVAVWFAVLRPTVRSAAQDAVRAPLRAAASTAALAGQQAAAAATQASQAVAAAGPAPSATPTTGSGRPSAPTPSAGKSHAPPHPSATATPTPTPTPISNAGAAAGGAPFNRDLTTSATAKHTGTVTFVVPAKKTLTVTDLVFESTGDTGTVAVLRDKVALITAHPEDYRTLDQHFVSPIVYTAGQRLVVQLNCTRPVAGQKQCSDGVYVGGSLQSVVTPAPSARPR